MAQQADDRTPVIIGVGQYQMDIPQDLSKAVGPIEITARAVKAAFKDSGLTDDPFQIDRLTAIRTFGDSGPMFPCPFGASKNMPRSIAKAAACDPKTVIYSPVGGDQPQVQIYETAKAIYEGQSDMAIVCGGEAIANMKAALRAGLKLNWSDNPETSDLKDEGPFPGGMLFDGEEIRHGLMSPLQFYALMETARRLKLGLSVQDYQAIIGELFAPFSEIAAQNPFSMFDKKYSPTEIATPSGANPLMSSPYTKAMVSKDGVNQGAAILMCSYKTAKKVGLDDSHFVYLHGFSKAEELSVSMRKDISVSPALNASLLGALSSAGLSKTDVKHLDLYSCFPIVVFNSASCLGRKLSDKLTQTGGLPFFGGPGNNYTLHGIAELVQTLRAHPGDYGLAQGNGGFMSKYAVGVYSTRPARTDIYQERKAASVETSDNISLDTSFEGKASLISYCLNYRKGTSKDATLLLAITDERRVLAQYKGELSALSQVSLGQKMRVENTPKGHIATLIK